MANRPNSEVPTKLPATAAAENVNAAEMPTCPPPPDHSPFPSAAQESVAGRYELLGEIARGGMGVVLRARDRVLNRDLAVKMLLEEHRDNPYFIRRFLEEAQIAGQLQHPCVVPIHELGKVADGRPFFAMKLVKGRTLRELLQERSAHGQDLPRFLGIFQQVCQAVAYVHSKRVIHRDLKPANIMVGNFNEVQVMDWGLAKVLDHPADKPAPKKESVTPLASVVESGRTPGAAALSQVGSALGTYAYMPPEQAQGATDQIDERADVFGLGAILCEILTGHPPYIGPTFEAVQLQAIMGETTQAQGRLEKSGGDAELIALAKKCLAAKPKERLTNASDVSAAMESYQTGVQERLRGSEQELAAAAARAIEQRKRRKVAWIAVALALLVVSVLGAWWMQQREQAAERSHQEALLAEKVNLALREVRVLRDQARRSSLGDWSAYQEAIRAAKYAYELARDNSHSAELQATAAELKEECEADLAAAQNDHRLLGRLLEVRNPREVTELRWGPAGLLMQVPEPDADAQFRAAFRDYGLDLATLSPTEASAQLQKRPEAVVVEIVLALDAWAAAKRRHRKPEAEWKKLVEFADLLDGDPGRRELRILLARNRLPAERALGELTRELLPLTRLVGVPGADRNRLRALAKATNGADAPVRGIPLLAGALRTAGDDREAEQLLKAALRTHPSEVSLLYALGKLYEEQDRWRDAAECYSAARAVRPELGVSLAWAQINSERKEEGLDLLEHLTRKYPDNPSLPFSLAYGCALAIRAELPAVMSAFQEMAEQAQGMAQGMTPAEQQKLAQKLLKQLVPQILGPTARRLEAASRRLIELSPKDVLGRYLLAGSLFQQVRMDEAISVYHDLLTLNPADRLGHLMLCLSFWLVGERTELRSELDTAFQLPSTTPQIEAQLFNALGAVLQGIDDASAERALREAVRLQPEEASYHSGLGDFHRNQKKYAAAAVEYRAAIRLQPGNAQFHIDLGSVFGDQKEYTQAAVAYREAVRIEPRNAFAHWALGQSLYEQGKYAEARGAFQRAVELEPKDSSNHWWLGDTLYQQGEYASAEAAFREADRLKPGQADTLNRLGNALFSQSKFETAEGIYREAIQVDPKVAAYHDNLGGALAAQNKYAAAEAAYREAIRLNPEVASYHHNLAKVLLDRTKYFEAECALQQAIRLDRKNAAYHHLRGNSLRFQGKYADAERAYGVAIELDSKQPTYHYDLAETLFEEDKLDPAEKSYRAALSIAPDNIAAREGLGQVLCSKEKSAEALAEFRRAQTLAQQAKDSAAEGLTDRLKVTERVVQVVPHIQDYVQGTRRPSDMTELRALERACKYKQLYGAGTRILAAAFKADPKTADDLNVQLRWLAANMAVLAADGQGNDAARLGADERSRLRKQALTYLRVDLDARAGQLANDKAPARGEARGELLYWQRDPHLASVRDERKLATLSPPEQAEWKQFWHDVEALLEKTRPK
jgi:serine/threonine-protein kinase